MLNSVFGMLSWLTPIIIGIVATPIIVRHLGASEYGIYSTVLGFISYSFSFGIGKVLIKFISEFKASGKNDLIGPAVSATFWFSLLLSLGGTVILAFSAKSIAVNVLSMPPELVEITTIALYLSCGAIAVTMLSQLFQFILQGLHRFGAFLLFTNISGLLLNIGNVALAVGGYDLNVLLTWNLISLSVMMVVFGICAVRALPEFSLKPKIAGQMMSPVVRYAVSIILYQLFGNVIFIFERMWLIRKFGPDAATYYHVPMTLGIYLQGVLSSAIQAIFPVMNEILDNKPKLIELYRRSTKVILAMVVFALVSTIAGGSQLLGAWIGPEMAERGYIILVIHVMTFGLISILMVVWSLSEAFRQASINTRLTFIWMAVSIPLMIAVADQYGSAGVAASRFIGLAINIPVIYFVEKKFLGSIQWRFWFDSLWRVIIAGAAALGVELLISGRMQSGWISVMVIGSAGLAIFVCASLLTGLVSSAERIQLTNTILHRHS